MARVFFLWACVCAAAATSAAPPVKLPAELPQVKAMLSEKAALLEKEIATRLLKRSQAGAGTSQLDLEIDLRVITRWMLERAAEQKPDSELQVCAYLRTGNLMNLVGALEEALNQRGEQPMTPPQLNAMGHLHDLSFTLGELRSAGQLDELCRDIAASALGIAGTRVDPRAVVVMRPKPPRPSSAPATGPAGSPRPPTIGQLTEEIRSLSLSAALKEQLLALAERTRILDGHSQAAKELLTLRGTLDEMVDVGKGLAGSSASGRKRAEIERRLAEALALFSDPRTRAAGQARLDALWEHRQILLRSARLQLPGQLLKQVGPALAWAQEYPAPGTRLVAALERFAAILAQYQTVGGNVDVLGALQKPLEDLRTQFQSRQSEFLDKVGQLGPGRPYAQGPDSLKPILEEMQHTLDMIELIHQLPGALDVLCSHNPKSADAFSKRALALATAAAISKGPGRDEVARSLGQITQLVLLCDKLKSDSLSDIPIEVAQGYGGGQIKAFQNRWRTLIGELAGQFASGADFDAAKLKQLSSGQQLCEALRAVSVLSISQQKTAVLTRWVDWGITEKQLQTVLRPYRDAMASGMVGFVNDDAAAMDRFLPMHRSYYPLVTLVNQAGTFGEQCAAMPAGLTGEISKLLTPLENQPFAAHRYVSLGLAAWSRCLERGDLAGADAAADLVSRRIIKELKGVLWGDQGG